MSHLHPTRVHPIVTKHLGHFNAAAAWYLEHHGQPSPERLAEIIAERDSSATRHMTGRDTCYVIDQDEWWPHMVQACRALMDEVLYPRERRDHLGTHSREWWDNVSIEGNPAGVCIHCGAGQDIDDKGCPASTTER